MAVGNIIRAYALNINGLQVFDVGDPSAPILLKNIYLGLGSKYNEMCLSGNSLFVGRFDRWFTFDVSDPHNPVEVCQVTLSGIVGEIDVRGDRAFVGILRYSAELNDFPAL